MHRPVDPSQRGYHAIYHEGEINHCPGCGRGHWIIGRRSAECAFCATALPLPYSCAPDRAPVIRHGSNLLLGRSPTRPDPGSARPEPVPSRKGGPVSGPVRTLKG